jgi:hypothetical protein
MGCPNKRAKHLRDAREAKRQRRLEEPDKDFSIGVLHEAHWEGLSDSEEESDIEISEPEDNISDEGRDLFERLLSAAKTEWSHGADTTKFLYQKGPTLSERQERRVRAVERRLAYAANTYSQPLSQFFPLASPIPNKVSVSTSELPCQLRRRAIDDLDPALNGECCATALLQSQRDFQEQKGWLQEEVEAAGHSIIFYPKFHCEINFTERFWCAAKHYTRENCEYTIDGLRRTIPEAFKSIPTATISRFYMHCSRIIDAYNNGYKYGTKAFINRVYKSHRRVEDELKW